MEYAIRSYIGTRKYQEDAAGACETEKGLFVIVCDGIGGRADGGASSEYTVKRLTDMFRNEFDDNFPSFITKAADMTDSEVFDAFGNNSGTTAVIIYICGGRLYWFSVGDSRIYIMRDDRIKQITADHTYRYVLELRKNKNIIDLETYERELPKGERLASFIGMGGVDIADVSLEPLHLKAGDRLLLTTDGLYKTLTENVIYGIISTNKGAEEAADELMDAVKEIDASKDNTTFALVYYDVTEEEV